MRTVAGMGEKSAVGGRDKQEARDRIWSLLQRERAARFPGARGRIPNFAGAKKAADRLAALAAWRGARVIKANPDLPQLPVRARALAEGKRVYMAVPRLAEEAPFMLLDPEHGRGCQEPPARVSRRDRGDRDRRARRRAVIARLCGVRG
ncbi:MAG: hypothetical protein ACRDN9_00900 [Streptosporangiaceae bacterium]